MKRSDVQIRGKDRRGAGNKGGWIPQRHVVAHICRKGTWILYAGGGEPWGYSAGCKLMVSPWHDGGWARPKGSAWSMDGVCAGSNGSCHDTRRSLAKTVSPSFPDRVENRYPPPVHEGCTCASSIVRNSQTCLPSCCWSISRVIYSRHRYSRVVRARRRDRSNLWDAKAIAFSLFMRGWEFSELEMPDT